MRTYNYTTYKNAEKKAEELGLVEAEYGEIYGANKGYTYWNKTGKRQDKAIVYAEYSYDENGYAI